MPVTAKLSRKFYDKLGDDVANELVDWFNAVDTSYRAEFRDLFEANFGQVRAEMAALRSELKSELKTEIAKSKTSLVFWMFGFWVGSWAAIVGTLVMLGRLGVLVPR